MRSFYEVLGVPEDADQDDIKRAFKREAAKCHPDRHPDDETATARFQELEQAYSVLKDPKKRSTYDATGMDSSSLAVKNRAYDTLVELYMRLLGSNDYRPMNYIPLMRKHIADKITEYTVLRDVAITNKKRLLYVIDHTAMNEPVVVRMLAYSRQFEDERLRFEATLAELEEMLSLVDDFEYTGKSEIVFPTRPGGPFTQANF